jgi:enamine deaminase RidA (YjgF/YER057c/UK114 family)
MKAVPAFFVAGRQAGQLAAKIEVLGKSSMATVREKTTQGRWGDSRATGQASRGSAVVRCIRGPAAREVVFLCRPAAAAGAQGQAEAAYRTLLDALNEEGLSPATIVSETVFCAAIEADWKAAVAGRRRVFGESGNPSQAPPTTWIGQRPLDNGDQVQIAALAVAPHRPELCSSTSMSQIPLCACEVCRAGARGRLGRIGDERHLHAANIVGAGRGGFEEVYDMFRVAEQLLGEAGMTFHDVIRTWIYLRDIDRDYDALNKARRAFFRDRGIERRPASTGVQGVPGSSAHDFSMALYAVKASRPLDAVLISTPTLNEAWTYGAEFSRGLRVADANKVALYISGTASIDEAGQTVHVGDLPAQADRMLHNVESLLAAEGATFADVVSAVTYVKRPGDAASLRKMFRERGIDGFPHALVEAPLCRRELLCETEVVAVLPLAP